MTTRQVKQVFKAFLHVSPVPDSLVYTSPIFQKLKTFGAIVSFQNDAVSTIPQGRSVAGPLSQRLYHVTFADESGLNKALSASPFSVDVDHNHGQLSPRTLDPYNLFGLQQQKPPEPRSFTCQLKPSHVEQVFNASPRVPSERVGAPPKVKLVRDRRSGPLYKSLLQADVPLGQLDGLATSMEYLTDITEPSDQPPHESMSLAGPPRLMERYRAAVEKERLKATMPDEPRCEEGEEVVPVRVRKYYMVHRVGQGYRQLGPAYWKPTTLANESRQAVSTENSRDNRDTNEQEGRTRKSGPNGWNKRL